MATLKIPLESTNTHTKKAIQVKGYQTAVGLDIDCMEGRIYWSDITGRAIRSALFNGSNKEDFIKDGEFLKNSKIIMILHYSDDILTKNRYFDFSKNHLNYFYKFTFILAFQNLAGNYIFYLYFERIS